jgi:BirA family biotin operon repressor/biotin-[acetyl-CoA-carboxylase] ligase
MRALTFAVLKRLSDDEFHSGETLARDLDVSRASVWNALNEASGYGVEVERVHGRGYRLAQRLDWLDAARIGAAVKDRALRVRVVDVCGSTNAELLRAAEAGAPGGEVLAAELQTQGRGRLGRAWHSGLGSSLTFSLLWRFDKSMASLGGLSLAVGLGVARALTGCGVDVGLKWPNDLLWRERKLGGILIEVRGDSLGPCAAVIGIGLNVRLAHDVKARIDQPTADLADAGAGNVARTEVLIAVLGALSEVLTRFERDGFGPLRSAWMHHHVHQDRPVTLSSPDGSRLHGVARGVDEHARLLLETDSGVRAIHTGDVSLRAVR